MTISAVSGPLGTFNSDNQTGTPQNTNPEQGPSFWNAGDMLLDPRYPVSYVPGQNFGKQVSGWIDGNVQTLNVVPYTATINNIAAAQTATSGTALTLASASATGVTIATITRMDTGASVTGLLALDSAATTVKFGQAQTIQVWDPTTLLARNIRLQLNGADQAGYYTVRGYDVYGNPMSEQIAGGTASVTTALIVAGSKAFKYVASVTPGGTVASTGVTVGTGDVIGFPIRADHFGHLRVTYGSTAVTANTGFTAGVTTAATATSGDVRGTWELSTSSNGVLRIVAQQYVSPSNIGTASGIVGVAQFSS